MTKSLLTRHCPYCQIEAEVTGMSAREIPGYKNPLTGKSVAMIERLSCSHEYVDGKFNVDSLYFSTPRIQQNPEHQNISTKSPVKYHFVFEEHKSDGGVKVLDILCAVCLIFLLVTAPPLAIVPAIYFIGRMMR